MSIPKAIAQEGTEKSPRGEEPHWWGWPNRCQGCAKKIPLNLRGALILATISPINTVRRYQKKEDWDPGGRPRGKSVKKERYETAKKDIKFARLEAVRGKANNTKTY